MKYGELHACTNCWEVFIPGAGDDSCPECKRRTVRPLRRAALEGRKLEDLPDLLTEEELAHWLSVELSTVQGWRYQGLIKEYIRIGRPKQGPVRYDHKAIRTYLANGRVEIAS